MEVSARGVHQHLYLVCLLLAKTSSTCACDACMRCATVAASRSMLMKAHACRVATRVNLLIILLVDCLNVSCSLVTDAGLHVCVRSGSILPAT